MTNLIFGIIWTTFTCLFIVIFLGGSIQNNTILNHGEPGFYFEPAMIIPAGMMLIFLVIGIAFIIVGLKKIIKDSMTKKHGVPCYGIIQDVDETGTYVNGQPEYKATLDIINPNTNQTEKIEEIVGFNQNKYPIHSYVLCKYYKGDINFERIIQPNELPSNYLDLLKPIDYISSAAYPNIEFSEDREYVTIDGVRYKKDVF